MAYPLISEYMNAVSSAEDNFATLTSLRPILGFDGKPLFSSGNFAVVFKMEDINTGEIFAIKCFTRDQDGRQEGYKSIASTLANVNAPYMAKVEYLEEELFVDSSVTHETEFPVVKMDWIEGSTLGQYVIENQDNHDALNRIISTFKDLGRWLLAQPFAHGDIKPDNIIVKKNGVFSLVDYDGMFVPGMEGEESREVGTPDYQHPRRTIKDFDRHIDDFSLSVILLSLKAMALMPELINDYDGGDVLLFSKKDYMDISSCSVFQKMGSLVTDEEFQEIYSNFLSVLLAGQLDYSSSSYINAFTTSTICSGTGMSRVFISDVLWNIAHKDYIVGMCIDNNYIEIFRDELKVRIAWNDNSYFMTATDGKKTAIEKFSGIHIRRLLVNVNILDDSLSNKIEIISGKSQHSVDHPDLSPQLARLWCRQHYPSIEDSVSFMALGNTLILSLQPSSDGVLIGNFISVISTDARFLNKLFWVGIRKVLIRDFQSGFEKTIELNQ